MTLSSSNLIVLHADQEHAGLRTTLLALLVVANGVGFLMLSTVLQEVVPESGYIGLISCIGALPLALAAVWVTERGLKRVWHSGRKISIDENGIQAKDRNRWQKQFSWSGNLTHLKWHFQLSGYPRGGSERRFPKRWLCLACQLQQNDVRLVVFSYLKPKQAAELMEGNLTDLRFHQIVPAEAYGGSVRARLGPPSRPIIPTSLLAGKDGRYWLAERLRWQEGFELTPADFETFVRKVVSR
jgi:hypothetical protein